MIRKIAPKTDTSSAMLATEFDIGSGDVLIAARDVALVKWESNATEPVKRATGIWSAGPISDIAMYPRAIPPKGRINV